MSEYQFYEFMAIDRLLTVSEQKTISQISSRTEATRYGASFVYHYGDFPRDEYQILAKYFDAMLYVTNWGTTRLMFRFPATIVDKAGLEQYEFSRSVVVSSAGDFIILDLNYSDEDGDRWGWVEGEGLLSRMVGLRQSIIEGDYRALFLVWLHAVLEEIEYEIILPGDVEVPPVPHNLINLSQELHALVDFFGISPELIRAGASFSTEHHTPELDIEQGLAQLSDTEKTDFLRRLAEGEPNLSLQFVKRLQAILNPGKTELISEAPSITSILERVKNADDAIKREKEAELNAYLDDLASRKDKIMEEIHYLISQKKVKQYEQAIAHLLELKKLALRDNTMADFNQTIQAIYKQYPTLKGLHSRMHWKGLEKK